MVQVCYHIKEFCENSVGLEARYRESCGLIDLFILTHESCTNFDIILLFSSKYSIY